MLKKTGYIEREQIDKNPASPTFNQVRWVRDLVPSNVCPNEIATSNVVTYYSQEIAEFLSVPDCAQAKVIMRQLPKGYKTSTNSQLEADTLARQYFNETNTEYVQQYGSCD